MKYSIQILFLVLLCVAGFSPPAAHAQGHGLKAEKAEMPDGYVLTAAYPNPFNPATSFSLTVRQRQNVEVQVYNMLGQPVKELFSGVMAANETRTFTFEASELPSGIYIYHVKGETFTAARRMSLVK